MQQKTKSGTVWTIFVIIFMAIFVMATTTNSNNIYISYNDTFLSNYNINNSMFLTDIKDLTASTKNLIWLDFDGVDDYVNLTNNSIFETINSSFTIMAFAYSTNLTVGANGRKDIITKSKSGDREYILATRDSNASNFIVWNNAGGIYTITTGAVPNENQWFHIAGKTDDSQAGKVYFNGLVSGTDASTSGNREISTNSEVLIGSITTASTNETKWQGRIDEVRFYNKSLDDKQIRRIYNESDYGSGLGKSIPVLSYHRIGEDVGSVSTIVNQSNFEEQMDWLNSSGYSTITYDNYYQWRNNNFTLPKKPIILVFDDGWLSVYTNATPVMDNYNFVGVQGIITQKALNVANYMNWTQIQNLSNKGWQIASHSFNATSIINYSDSDLLRALNGTKYEIDGNISIIPTLFIMPNNENNDTTDSECAKYYTMCSGYSTSTNTQEAFLFKKANLTHENGNSIGMRRIIIANDTTLTEMINAVDYFDGLIGYYKFNENNNSVVYDVSSYGNNGTISGATWNNNGIDNILTQNIDYNLDTSSGIFKILNSEYSWSEIFLDYNSTTDFINNTKTTTQIFNLNGLTNALVYLNNGTLSGNTEISNNDGNINISLPSGNWAYILDNFNLTEGISRENSPIWLTSSSPILKTIASNITQNINFTAIFNPYPKLCSQIKSVSERSNSGNFTRTLVQGIDYTCMEDLINISLQNVEYSQGSHEIIMSYLGDGVCDAWEIQDSADCIGGITQRSSDIPGLFDLISNKTISKDNNNITIPPAQVGNEVVSLPMDLTIVILLVIISIVVIGSIVIFLLLEAKKPKKRSGRIPTIKGGGS